jgi:magnesium chelatase subunit D
MSAAADARPTFPFSAVVGADEAKLALLLVTIDPAIGGVLLRGDKGAAKTTLARALAVLTADDAPFVNLPLGATEERVVGSLDLAAALSGEGVRVQPGLLAAAHRGVLYVDEVNILADHLVDVLLDVAVSGTNRIERDGISHAHPARFVLVGSMNPEEGELRPQLLDRFGLAVDVRAPLDPAVRAAAVRRRLDHDADPVAFAQGWAQEEAALRARLERSRSAELDDDVLRAVSALCAASGCEGLRADLVLARAAAAHAGWHGRDHVTADDVRATAPLVLAHRGRHDPLDPPGPPPDLDHLIDERFGAGEPPSSSGADDQGRPAPAPGATDGDDHDPSGQGEERAVSSDATAAAVVALRAPARRQEAASGRRSPVTADRGRAIGSRPTAGTATAVAPVATLTAAAHRWAADPDAPRRVESTDLHEPVRATRTGNLLVLAVDTSGSMGATERVAAVRGALLGLLIDAYQRRDRVALVAFGGAGAEVVLRPTASVEVARTRLDGVTTGGDTPLAAGIDAALQVAEASGTADLQPILVLVTDGRATAGADPYGAAVASAAAVARRRVPAVVVDVEPHGPGRLGLAAEIAAAMGARHLSLADLTAARLEGALRHL